MDFKTLGGKIPTTEPELYISGKADQTTGGFITQLRSQESDDLKIANCILLPYISGSYSPIGLIKKRIRFSRLVLQNNQHRSP
jgi:hypothetical protein